MTKHDIEQAYQHLLAEDSPDPRHISYKRKSAMLTLAHIIVEEQHLQADILQHLQADILENGQFYETTGDKGQKLLKKRPQYEELGRLRDRKLRYSKELGIAVAPTFADEF
jgi:hypothetical protein